ncbi:MAG: sugar ABC transporter substrate-binding protein, partial [Candidatus Thermofonsia bacterium]
EGSSYQDVLKTELAAGTAPDVFWIPGTDVADFAKRGLIMNLREMADATEGYSDDAFYPGPMFHLTFNPETGNTGEALWGLPRDVSTFALYLNLDLLAESGAPDPRELAANGEWNWDAFVEVASAIDALGDDIFGYGQNAWWGPYGYWLNAAGGGFFNEDRTACALDTPESLAGLEFEQRIYQEFDIAVPYGEDSEPPFLAGKVGMFQNGRWATPGVRASANFDWDVVELPDGPAGPSNWLFWGAYVVNANTEHPEEAWQLVQALTTAETQAKIAELGANIPSRVSQEALDAFLTFTPPANNQAFLNGLSRNPATEGPLWAGNWPEFDAVMGPAVTAVLNGEKSIDDFAATICDEANKTFDQ